MKKFYCVMMLFFAFIGINLEAVNNTDEFRKEIQRLNPQDKYVIVDAQEIDRYEAYVNISEDRFFDQVITILNINYKIELDNGKKIVLTIRGSSNEKFSSFYLEPGDQIQFGTEPKLFIDYKTGIKFTIFRNNTSITYHGIIN